MVSRTGYRCEHGQSGRTRCRLRQADNMQLIQPVEIPQTSARQGQQGPRHQRCRHQKVSGRCHTRGNLVPSGRPRCTYLLNQQSHPRSGQ